MVLRSGSREIWSVGMYLNNNPVNYYELEEKISKLVNSRPIIKAVGIREIVKDFEMQISVVKRQIKLREKEIIINIKNEKRVKKFYEVPHWKDKSKCPMCNAKLVKKWEGLVCQNNCSLNFKIGKGWVYLQSDSGWSKSREYVNSCFSSRRNYMQKEFAKLRKEVIRRDDYKCRMCSYSLTDDYYFKVGLCVHHIIPASEEMALFLDKDNLITLCKDCHLKIHKEDKYNFGVKNEFNS